MLQMPPRQRPKPQRRATFLREWRDHRRLTQEQAAERLGIEQPTLSRIERGISPYGQDFLEKAAFLYRVEPWDLLNRHPDSDDVIWSVADQLRRASPDEQRRAKDILDAFLKKPD